MKSICILLLLLVACQSQGPALEEEMERQDVGVMSAQDMTVLDDARVDGSVADAVVADAEPTPLDAGLLDQWVREPMPSPEINCDGIDDDDDGLLDEGIANICGGCEPIPPEGCQGWQINTIGREDGRIFPDRIVGLAAHVLKNESFETDNGSCALRIYQSPPDPEAHLGQVSVATDLVELNLEPHYDAVRETLGYRPGEGLDPILFEFENPTLSVETSGGMWVDPFEGQMELPAPLRGVSEEALNVIVDASRGEANAGSTSLHWLPDNGPVSLYVGGSLPLFENGRNYRGIEHYILRARLADDGVFRVPVEVFDGGIEDSSVWVYLMRDRYKNIPLGPHAVSMASGRRIEARGAGRQQGDREPPFQILSPAPNLPVIEPGEPLLIRWSALPEGSGPMTATISLRMAQSGQHHQLVCTVADPALGELTLPGEQTDPWRLEPGDFHQLTLNWVIDRRYFSEADAGSRHRSQAVLLRLDR